jgi:hypothetical protein
VGGLQEGQLSLLEGSNLGGGVRTFLTDAVNMARLVLLGAPHGHQASEVCLHAAEQLVEDSAGLAVLWLCEFGCQGVNTGASLASFRLHNPPSPPPHLPGH